MTAEVTVIVGEEDGKFVGLMVGVRVVGGIVGLSVGE